MKLFGILFSLYFLFLAVMPCGDAEAHGINSESIEYSVLHATEADDHSEADLCSPLCVCQCCGSFTILHSSSNTSFIKELVSLSSGFHQPALAEASISIWQPPKL